MGKTRYYDDPEAIEDEELSDEELSAASDMLADLENGTHYQKQAEAQRAMAQEAATPEAKERSRIYFLNVGRP